jgi:hypothetical protein
MPGTWLAIIWQSSFPSRYSLEMLEIGQITQKVETQTNEVRVMGEEDPQGLACIIRTQELLSFA